MARIRAVILDFDGVLAESNKVKDAAFNEFFSRYPEHAAAMRACLKRPFLDLSGD